MQRHRVLYVFTGPFLGPVWTVFRETIASAPTDRLTAHVALDRGAEGEIGLAPEAARVTRWPLQPTLRAALHTGISIAQLGAYARRHGISIVHCSEDALSCAIGLAVGRIARARVLVHHHAAPSQYGAIRRRSLIAASHLADLNVGVSEYIRQSLVDYGANPARVATVLNGIHVGSYETAPDRDEARRALGLAPEDLLVLQVSRLWRPKRPEDLLRAVALARARLPHLRGIVVGWEDPRYDGGHASYSAELEHLAGELGVRDAFSVLRPRPDVRPLYAACDIVAMPAIDEPFGLVVAEGMASRRPVVGVRSGATPEIVVDGVTGFLVPPRDPAAMAAALVQLGEDSDLRARMGAAGHARVVRCFSADRLGRDFADLYDRMSARGAGPCGAR